MRGKGKVFRAYWLQGKRTEIWSFRARSLDEAKQIVCGTNKEPGVVPVRPVEIEDEMAVERMVVK